MSDLISIIIPMYNASSRINACLESIINQSYKDLEIIVVDDGSKDDSLEKAQVYAARDTRIKVLHQENGGVSRARNHGFKESHGKYIQYVDSDDTLDFQMIEIMHDLLIENNAELSMCNNEHPFMMSFLPDKVFNLKDKEDFLEFYQQIYAPLWPWNKMWKREAIEDVRFDENIKFSEDELYCCGAYKNVSKAVTTSKRLYHYYMSQDGSDDGMIMRMIKKGVVESENTFYFMGYKVLGPRIEYFKKGIEEGKLPFDDVREIAYCRVFDYVFMEWFVYTVANIPERMLFNELNKIYNTQEFQNSLYLHEEYGFKFFKSNDKEFNLRLVICNALMINTMRKAMEKKIKAIPTHIAMASFVSVMSKPESNPVFSKNILNELYFELEDNATPLAKLINGEIKRLNLNKLFAKTKVVKSLPHFETISEIINK